MRLFYLCRFGLADHIVAAQRVGQTRLPESACSRKSPHLEYPHKRQRQIKVMKANLALLRLNDKLIDRPFFIATTTATAASSAP